jgi:hypothetical protein
VGLDCGWLSLVCVERDLGALTIFGFSGDKGTNYVERTS